MKNLKYLLILLPALMFSQAPRGFYLLAGLNNSTLKSSDLLSDSGMGYTAGLNFNFGYHETYNYQVEFLYNHSILKLKSLDNSFQNIGETDYTFPTFSGGVYFNYYILLPDEDKFFLGLQVGPSLSSGGVFTPKGKVDVNDEVYLPYLLDENDLTFTPKILFNVGLGLTGGYNDFRFDLRYTKGLSNVLAEMEVPYRNDDNNLYKGPVLKGKLDIISFTISYRVNKLFGAE